MLLLEIMLYRLARAHRVARIEAGDRLQEERAVPGAARERPDGVERMGKRHRAVARHAAPGGLETCYAARRRRQAHGAPGVRAERAEREARRHRGGGAAGGAAGDVVGVPGIAAIAEVLVVPGGTVG